MTYKVPVSGGKKRENQFAFTLPGSTKKHYLPFLEYLTGNDFDLLAKIESDEGGDFTKVAAIYDLIEGVGGVSVRELDGAQVGGLFGAWREASVVRPGEADGSAD